MQPERCSTKLEHVASRVCEPTPSASHCIAKHVDSPPRRHASSASQVLAEAKAIDASKAAGNDTGPLCGLPFVVKDNIDVVGYATVAGTPALEGNPSAAPCNRINKLLLPSFQRRHCYLVADAAWLWHILDAVSVPVMHVVVLPTL